MHVEYKLTGGDFTKAGYASSEVKKILKQLNIDFRIIKRVVVALYEAEVNIVAHAFEGVIKVEIDKDKIILVLTDKGPGIPDIELAMTEGFSTASEKVRQMGFGAGLGLPNMKRNTDKLIVESVVGEGTRVEMVHYFTQQIV